jgi:hypothetical protein
LVQGELACVQGELFVVFELCIIGSCSLIEHCFVSDVSKTCLLQVILFFAFLLVFNCLLEFLLVVSFLFFSFSLGYQNVCVVNALIKGGLRAMCGSRTGGWSLPGVMSD